MACSKLFSGDLPELTNYIIQGLRNDIKSLYSCIFVNRLLCRIAIPILWEDPFSIIRREDYPYNVLDTYLSFFNKDDQTKLKGFGIPIKSPSFKTPLFNYPSFIKTLNTVRVELHAVNWINNLDVLPDPNDKVKSNRIKFLPFYTENTSLKLKNPSLDVKVIDFVCTTLFKLFINNDVSLNDFNIRIDYLYGRFLFEIYEMILENPKFISKIENFALYFLDGGYNDPNYNHPNLIQSQSQLLSISLYFRTINISLSDAFKYCSNTLTSITFEFCNFANLS